MSDAVKHPDHYNRGKIEVWDFIIDQGLDYCLGNVVNYVCRCSHKGRELEDLKKAMAYLKRRIQQVEGTTAVEVPPLMPTTLPERMEVILRHKSTWITRNELVEILDLCQPPLDLPDIKVSMDLNINRNSKFALRPMRLVGLAEWTKTVEK